LFSAFAVSAKAPTAKASITIARMKNPILTLPYVTFLICCV
jgi:hypothetical protein